MLASDHIADDPSEQARELSVMADTGVDCLVLVSNWLDPENAGGAEALAALSEPMGCPKLAKLHHQWLGTFMGDYSRAVTADILATYWALDAVMEKISEGTNIWPQRISDLG